MTNRHKKKPIKYRHLILYFSKKNYKIIFFLLPFPTFGFRRLPHPRQYFSSSSSIKTKSALMSSSSKSLQSHSDFRDPGSLDDGPAANVDSADGAIGSSTSIASSTIGCISAAPVFPPLSPSSSNLIFFACGF